MKKPFEMPLVELVKFEAEAVLNDGVASLPTDDDGGVALPWGYLNPLPRRQLPPREFLYHARWRRGKAPPSFWVYTM